MDLNGVFRTRDSRRILLSIALLIMISQAVFAADNYINTVDGSNFSIGNDNGLFIDNTHGSVGIGSVDTLFLDNPAFPFLLAVGDGSNNLSAYFNATKSAIVAEANASEAATIDGAGAIKGLVTDSSGDTVVEGGLGGFDDDYGWMGAYAGNDNSSGRTESYLAGKDIAVFGFADSSINNGTGGYFITEGANSVALFGNASGTGVVPVSGRIGVFGSGNDYGIYASAAYVSGILAISNGGSGIGVEGYTSASGYAGVVGTSVNTYGEGRLGHVSGVAEYGVYGYAGAAGVPLAIGVYGYASGDTNNYGAYGNGTSYGAYGVYRVDPTKYGYMGSSGYGVYGAYDSDRYGYIGANGVGIGALGLLTNTFGMLGEGSGAGGYFTDNDDPADIILYAGMNSYTIDGTDYGAGIIGVDTDTVGTDYGVIGRGTTGGIKGCDYDYDCDSELYGILGYDVYGAYGYADTDGAGIYGNGGSTGTGVYANSAATVSFGALYGSSSGYTAVASNGSMEIESGSLCVDDLNNCSSSEVGDGDVAIKDGSFCVDDGSGHCDASASTVNITDGDIMVMDGFVCVDDGGQNCDDYVRTDGQVYVLGVPSAPGTTPNAYVYPTVGSAYGRIYRSTASSARYKENIIDSDIGLEAVLRMRPVEFDYIPGYVEEEDLRQLGFIAEEVEEVSPLLVDYAEMLDEDGVLANVTESVKYDKLSSIIVKAVQEQQVILERQEQEIAGLEEQLASRRERLESLKEELSLKN